MIEETARKGVTRYGPADGVPRFLSDVIIELGLAEASAVEEAVEAARGSGGTVGAVLVRSGTLTEDQLARAIAARYGLDHVDLNEFDVDPSAANLLPPAAAQRYRAVPVCFEDDGSLLVAFADPSDSLALSDIAFMTKLDIRPAVAAGDLISGLINQLPMPVATGSEQGSASSSGYTRAPTISPPQSTVPPAEPPRQAEPPVPSAEDHARIEALETELAEAVTALEDERRAHAAELEARAQELGRLQEQRERDGAEMQASHALQTELDDLRRQLDGLRAEADAGRSEAAARAEELQALRADARARSDELQALRAEASARSDELEAARTESSAARGELEAARAEASARAEELDAARAEASAVREELEAARADAGRHAAELDQAKAAASSASERTEAAEQRAQQAEAVAQAAEQRGQEAEQRAKEAEARLDELAGAERLAAEAREMLGKLREEFELEREAYAAKERELRAKLAATDELRATVGRLTNQLASGARELAEAVAGHEDTRSARPDSQVETPADFEPAVERHSYFD